MSRTERKTRNVNGFEASEYNINTSVQLNTSADQQQYHLQTFEDTFHIK